MGGKTGKPTLASSIKKADGMLSSVRAGRKNLDGIGSKLDKVQRKLSDMKQSREGRR